MIGVTYSDYILPLLVCGNCRLTLKMGGCCNMLESTLARTPLIESSHKWTRILYIISNFKLGIWIFSQPKIDLNLQFNLYGVPTLDHTRICRTQSKIYILGINSTFSSSIHYHQCLGFPL